MIRTPTGLPLATPTSHGYTGTVTLTLFLQQMSSTFCYFYNYLTLQLLKIQLLSGSIIELTIQKTVVRFSNCTSLSKIRKNQPSDWEDPKMIHDSFDNWFTEVW